MNIRRLESGDSVPAALVDPLDVVITCLNSHFLSYPVKAMLQ